MPTLEIRDLHKRYGDVVALDGCDLRVEQASMVGFLGPNGAGKTTLMRAVLGLIAFDSGTITWDGEPIGPAHRRRIGYMPQERGLYPRMKVAEQVSYFGRLAGLSRAEAARRADHWIGRVGLSDRRDAMLQELSVGNQQRVQLAVALVHEPSLLVLDEPFAGLDPVAVRSMSDVLAEQLARGVSVVFSSHQLELVQDLCEDVTIIAAGSTIASGTVSDLRERSERRCFDIVWETPPEGDWTPSGVDVVDRTVSGRRSSFQVAAYTAPAPLIDEASRVGVIRSVSFEPPDLDEVFLEMVGS